jgi:hypothetical protein
MLSSKIIEPSDTFDQIEWKVFLNRRREQCVVLFQFFQYSLEIRMQVSRAKKPLSGPCSSFCADGTKKEIYLIFPQKRTKRVVAARRMHHRAV